MNNELKKRKRGRYNAWKFDSNLEIPSSTRYCHQKRLVSHQEQNYNSVQMHLANSPQNVTSQPQLQNNIQAAEILSISFHEPNEQSNEIYTQSSLESEEIDVDSSSDSNEEENEVLDGKLNY
jgi:hypothetical protein